MFLCVWFFLFLFILSVQAHVLDSCKCFVCVWVYVWWNSMAAQSVLVLCCRLNKKKNTSCKEKISGILLFSPTDSGKKTRSITSFHFVSFANLCKKLKRKNTKTHTHIQKKVEETQEKTDVNLYLNGAILIFISYVCVWIFTTFVESSKKRPKKSLFNAGHLQIVNSFLIVQQTKQHTAPSLAMRSECVDWSVVTANLRFFFSTNFPLEIEYPFINH